MLAAVFKDGRTIPSVEVTALMAEMLNLQPGEKLMEIGTGSGFQTQRWAALGANVHTIECKPVVDPERKGAAQIYAKIGDGKNGIPEHAPFDAVVATCGVTDIPGAWVKQLRDGGRMVIPMGNVGSQSLLLLVKKDGMLEPQRVGAYVRFSMME